MSQIDKRFGKGLRPEKDAACLPVSDDDKFDRLTSALASPIKTISKIRRWGLDSKEPRENEPNYGISNRIILIAELGAVREAVEAVEDILAEGVTRQSREGAERLSVLETQLAAVSRNHGVEAAAGILKGQGFRTLLQAAADSDGFHNVLKRCQDLNGENDVSPMKPGEKYSAPPVYSTVEGVYSKAPDGTLLDDFVDISVHDAMARYKHWNDGATAREVMDILLRLRERFGSRRSAAYVLAWSGVSTVSNLLAEMNSRKVMRAKIIKATAALLSLTDGSDEDE